MNALRAEKPDAESPIAVYDLFHAGWSIAGTARFLGIKPAAAEQMLREERRRIVRPRP